MVYNVGAAILALLGFVLTIMEIQSLLGFITNTQYIDINHFLSLLLLKVSIYVLIISD